MKLSYLQIVYLLLASLNTVSSNLESQCDFYIAPSKVLKNHMGIFAGRKYNKGEHKAHAITVRYPSNEGWQLSKYVFGAVATELSGIVVLEFGPSMIYNHHEMNNVQHFAIDNWDDSNYKTFLFPQMSAFQLLEANTIFPLNFFYVNEDVLPGEEMYSDYGDTWFTIKGIELITSTRQESSYASMSELENVGHCVSNIRTNNSGIISQESTGQGVFASVDFKEGELVDVSPVLVLPKHEVQKASDSTCVLINFCFSRPDSYLAFLPIGYGAVCNHGGKNANVAIEWHCWGGSFKEDVFKLSPKDLLQLESAKLYFGYRALRDIKMGEEILIDYGESWEADWNKYLKAKKEFKKLQPNIPLFRRPIELPESMFSYNWYTDCIV